LRRIPLSHRSHIIGFQPLAVGIAEHESALERDFVTVTSFLEPDASITSQPVTIGFFDGEVHRRYTPDFLVRPISRRSALIEVKYRADLRTQWQRLKPAFAAARAWAKERDAVFRIVTERQIRGPVLENAKRLLPLRFAPLDVEVAHQALHAIGPLDAPTFGTVLAALSMGRRTALATIWRLIARGTLRVDLSKPITLDTPIIKV
jgi:hypothetical protein